MTLQFHSVVQLTENNQSKKQYQQNAAFRTEIKMPKFYQDSGFTNAFTEMCSNSMQ